MRPSSRRWEKHRAERLGDSEQAAREEPGEEREGRLQQEAQREGRLGDGVEGPGTRLEQALEVFLRGERERGQDGEEGGRGPPAAMPAGREQRDAAHTEDRGRHERTRKNREVREVTVPRVLQQRAALGAVGRREEVRGRVRSDTARQHDGQ